MTKEQAYNTLCDIAEDSGSTVEELLTALQVQSDSLFEKSISAIPETARGYIKSAHDSRRTARENARGTEEKEKLNAEIKRFRALFPEVGAEDIPDAVWEDMQKGIPLPYSYALYLVTEGNGNAYANGVNERNGSAALPPVNNEEGDGELTMEEVEAMSPDAVKRSFPQILRSLGKWKI